jgi:hypothetical protein
VPDGAEGEPDGFGALYARLVPAPREEPYERPSWSPVAPLALLAMAVALVPPARADVSLGG